MPPTTAPRGLLLVISGPSGVGKTTIARAVEQQLQGHFSVSVTTRAATAKDRPGVDYHFISREEFARLRQGGELLEWAEVYEGLFYGTPRRPVEEAVAAGRLMILEIDVQGAQQVKAKLPEAFTVFILPPNLRVLLDRLRGRGRDEEAAIQKRFAQARREITLAWESGVYDQFVLNRHLDQAIAETVALVRQRLG